MTYVSDLSVALLLSASDSLVAPASPIWLPLRLLFRETRRVRVALQGAGRARATYLSDVSVALHLSASDSAAAPAWSTLLQPRLQRGAECQGCMAQGSARATYLSNVSAALFLSASANAAAAASPIWFLHRLRRVDEGEGCRHGGTERLVLT